MQLQYCSEGLDPSLLRRSSKLFRLSDFQECKPAIWLSTRQAAFKQQTKGISLSWKTLVGKIKVVVWTTQQLANWRWQIYLSWFNKTWTPKSSLEGLQTSGVGKTWGGLPSGTATAVSPGLGLTTQGSPGSAVEIGGRLVQCFALFLQKLCFA